MDAGKEYTPYHYYYAKYIIIYLLNHVNVRKGEEKSLSYGIYFDESNKLDQPDGNYSYYGALGAKTSVMKDIIREVIKIKRSLKTKSELHFVEYKKDQDFEKYFKILNYILSQDIKINLMIVHKKDAEIVANEMDIKLLELRELFYVKIPERLFYGMTRQLKTGQSVRIVIDENSEYDNLGLERKIEEQMNAHAAYRHKGYKVAKVKQSTSDKNIALQLIDVLMGMVVFILEEQYKRKDSNTTLVKQDLIYRILIENDNLNKLHSKLTIFKWGRNNKEIEVEQFSKYTGKFIIEKTKKDIQEMTRLREIMLKHPSETTKFYRLQMGYTNSQVRMLQGYLSELKGEGRNSYYFK